MSRPVKAYVGAAIHDGTVLQDGKVFLTFQDGRAEIADQAVIPEDCAVHQFAGGTILPGFVDLQVNGGGGVMFNDDQSVAALRVMAQAHASLGTAALLPTLITDTPERTLAAINAVEQAIAEQVPGIIGIHLEGPHLSIARKGAHDPALIRPMCDDDLAMLLSANDRLPNVMVTVAPENTALAQIKALSKAGVIVSLGHTDASFDTCMAAFDAGARCVTHLFNAMSQLGSREPGLVGATLAHGEVYAGLIADAVHVHPATIGAAFAAKSGSERIFLVTDAMATAGSEITGFNLNRRRVQRNDGRLTLSDGTLAGADVDMARSLSVLVGMVGEDLSGSISRATSTPAKVLRERFGNGCFREQTAGMIYLDRTGSRPHWIHEL